MVAHVVAEMLTSPIVAREVNSSVPGGRSFADEFARPLCVSVRTLFQMNLGPISEGVNQGIAHHQYSETEVSGVPPLTISAKLPRVFIVHSGNSPQSSFLNRTSCRKIFSATPRLYSLRRSSFLSYSEILAAMAERNEATFSVSSSSLGRGM